MKQSSRAVSLLLSGVMAATCFGSVMTASAAAVDSEATGAILTLEERIAAGHELVFFQFPEKVWGDVKNVKRSTKKHTVNVYFQLYAIYGNQKEVTTKTKGSPSSCMIADQGGSDTFYYDITESKLIAEKVNDDDHKLEPGAVYGIRFSTSANADDPNTLRPNDYGYQTCELYFTTDCLGDTYVVDEPAKMRENAENSQHIDYDAHSLNGVGVPIDDAPDLELPAVKMANMLKKYLPSPINEQSFSREKTKMVMDRLETNAVDVYWMYDQLFGGDYAKGTQHRHADGDHDLKPDGTLKDCFRFRYLVKNAGTAEAMTEMYPDYTLVAERLGLIEPGSVAEPVPPCDVIPKRIASVELTRKNNSVAIPDGAPYSVSMVRNNGQVIATVSPNAGYAFSAKPVCHLTDFCECLTIAYDNGKSFIDTVDGKIVLTGTPPEEWIGDVDGDGDITIRDATLIQRRGVELEAFTELQNRLADTDGDGRVSILDVTCVQRYIAEMTEGIGNTGKQLYT